MAIVVIIIGFLSGILDFVINRKNDLLMYIIALLFGLATCYGTYYFLEKNGKKKWLPWIQLMILAKLPKINFFHPIFYVNLHSHFEGHNFLK